MKADTGHYACIGDESLYGKRLASAFSQPKRMTEMGQIERLPPTRLNGRYRLR
jgi:hypothetical protein